MDAYNSIGQRVAKRRRLDFELPNADQIIKNQQQVIESLRAEIARKDKRIQELEDQLKPQKNLESLPNECLLKIMSYLSNHDVLKNVAGVSKRFLELSEDKHLIRNIRVNSETWQYMREFSGGYVCNEHESAIQADLKAHKEKYIEDLLKVLKRSLKLRYLSLDFGREADKFLEALPMMNHQFLEELRLTGDGVLHESGWGSFFIYLDFIISPNLLKYLLKCTELKVLIFDTQPKVSLSSDQPNYGLAVEAVTYPNLSSIENTLNSLKLKNLQELHLNGFRIDLNKSECKKLLETIAKNMPKLKLLCLTGELDNDEELDEYVKICQEFALAKNINLEIRDYPVVCTHLWAWPYRTCPSDDVQIYSPK